MTPAPLPVELQPDATGDVWALVFAAQPRDVPAAVRVRRLLKLARSLGFRCVYVGSELPKPPGGGVSDSSATT
jgi:hypothetical protein